MKFLCPQPSFSSTVLLVALTSAGTFRFSCDESLPPYSPPVSLFQGALAGRTVPTRWNNQMYVYLTITNTYTETLQSHGKLLGTLEIILERDPQHRRTVTLDSTLFVDAHFLDTLTGLVTMNPGETMTFRYRWDILDDEGNYFPVSVFRMKRDTACPTLNRALPETFILKSSFQVFDRIGQVVASPVNFVFEYWAGTLC